MNLSSNKTIAQVIVLGGGAAGWLSAGRIASAHPQISVSVIESPNRGILGVGEGTWPSMRETLRKIGVSETEFLRECDASFKQGSWFKQWLSEDDHHGYCHPFTTPFAYQETDMHRVWQHAKALFNNADPASVSYAALMSPQSIVCELNKSPKLFETPEYAGVLSYGYHLDAHKFAVFLEKHCTQKLGVNHILADIAEVQNDNDSKNIKALISDTGESYEGDLFIDCSGMQSRLIGQHYKIDSVDVSPHLINNQAVAAHVPYAKSDSINTCTLATARKDGWIWDIGLRSRRGVGKVYSDLFSDREQAESDLREYIAKTACHLNAAELSYKHLSFKPAYRKRFWQNNCVAIGMSAGFVEPIEASALAMTELSLNMLIDDFPQNQQHMTLVSKRFNQRFNYRWERVVDFIHLHYLLSQRRDSEYWQRMSDVCFASEGLQDLLELWKYQAPSRHDLIQNEEVFPSASYQFVLYGMQYSTNIGNSVSPQFHNKVDNILEHNREKTIQFTQKLPELKTLLSQICH